MAEANSVAEATDSLSFLCWGGGIFPSCHSDEERLQGCPELKLLTGTKAVRPCFIEILGMWASSLKILFIHLRERDSQQNGNPSRGVGEEEAGSQWRSTMRDSFLERCDHTLIRRQVLNDCTTQSLRVVGFLIFSLPSGGGAYPKPVWVETPCPL